MLVLVCYDVNTLEKVGRARLRKIAKTCENYGQRVQYSVFECEIGKAQWVLLRHRLLQIHDPAEDSLRFYFLDETVRGSVEHHGIGEPRDLREALIV
ncbi:MAG: CRISPR-associated endonuclease Cas2 [bacterium]